MTAKCVDPLDYAITQLAKHPCWLCELPEDIFDSGLCAECYAWAMDNTPQDATEAEIITAYRKPTMVRRLIATIQAL